MKLCGFEVGDRRPFFLMAGPCVIESEQMVLDIAGFMHETCEKLGILYIFKASFDKANRTSGASFRGPGLAEGLRILSEVKKQIGVPVVTDVHTEEQVPEVAAVVDVLQTPAFLCRQTDFIRACAASGKPVNIKKGQFLSPYDMVHVVQKAREAAREAHVSDDCVMVCERGASFGYGNLVCDLRLRLCAAPTPPLSLMRHTRCSYPAETVPPRAEIGALFRSFRAARWRPESTAYLWKPIRTRCMPKATGRTVLC